MRALVVFAHPDPQSFGASILATVRAALEAAGHEVRVIDLYAEGFDPVLSREDWGSYLSDTTHLAGKVAPHVEALRWAEALIMVFPTWMYGPPAILKGWMERVWLPGIAFDVPAGRMRRAVGKLVNIRRFVVITTSGSPRWWLWLIRDPARSMLVRGYRILFHWRCRVRWLQMYDMNHQTRDELSGFLARVDRTMRRL